MLLNTYDLMIKNMMLPSSFDLLFSGMRGWENGRQDLKWMIMTAQDNKRRDKKKLP